MLIFASSLTKIVRYISETKMQVSRPVNCVYHKMLLNENESYLVLMARQILLVTINYVYYIRPETIFRLAFFARELIIE